jgi:hypothetical protein
MEQTGNVALVRLAIMRSPPFLVVQERLGARQTLVEAVKPMGER